MSGVEGAREAIGPAARQRIERALRACGEWRGTRAHRRIRLAIITHPATRRLAVEFEVVIRRRHNRGLAINVFDAVEQINRAIAAAPIAVRRPEQISLFSSHAA